MNFSQIVITEESLSATFNVNYHKIDLMLTITLSTEMPI